MSKNSSIIKHLDFTLFDLFCLALSFFISYLIKINDSIRDNNQLYIWVFLLIILLNILYALIFNPYHNILRRGVLEEFQCTLLNILFNLLSVSAVLYVFKIGYMYSRIQLSLTYVFYFFIASIVRILWKQHLILKKKTNKINVFIITESKNVDSVIFNIENSEFSEYSISGIYLTDVRKAKKIDGYNVYSEKDSLYDSVIGNNVLEVFAFCNPSMIRSEDVRKIVEEGIEYHISVNRIFDYESDNKELSNIAMYQTLNFNTFTFTPLQILYDPLKRFFDIILSLFACLFLLPIYLVIKFSYLMDGDKKTIFYTHTRVGKNGKEFKLYKFRSMVYNADEILKEMLKNDDYKKEWEENHKFDNDPRITRIGNFIRRTSIDEFPQFLNVLKGDMSIIGPRPLVPGELKSKNGLSLYERVKPGITGWWACNGRSSISYEERLELEYFYVKNYSLGLDLMCILKTIYVVLFRKGAK